MWTLDGLGFEDLGSGWRRVGRFGLWMAQGSRIWLVNGAGFEDLVSGWPRVRGFGFWMGGY